MKSTTTKKIAIAGMLIAIGVIGGAWSFPIGASKCAPVQHLVNILAATTLGPWYGIIMAFITSCIRLAMGTGTLMAFPGSMCGAFLAGVLCMAFKKMNFPKKENIFGNGTLGAVIGELFGTAVIGGMLAYPIATMIMGKEAALFTYVFPFFVSTLGGTIIGTIVYIALRKTKALDKMGI
ncbi:MAG: energy coupling factor transporter S component ThiW [Clostridia bacterium]|nr:energy coupling factor transporter S component ThiW [Clostridia bacterium]